MERKRAGGGERVSEREREREREREKGDRQTDREREEQASERASERDSHDTHAHTVQTSDACLFLSAIVKDGLRSAKALSICSCVTTALLSISPPFPPGS